MYVDTSVLVAYYCPEPMSLQVEVLLRNEPDPNISDLTEIEFCSAIAQKVRQKELKREAGLRVLSQFRTHLEGEWYSRILLGPRHYQLAREWLSQLEWPIRSLDALHMAVAEVANTTLVTADSHMAQTAKSLGLSVLVMTSSTHGRKA